MKKTNKKTIAELKKICNPIYKQAFIEAEKAYHEIIRNAGLKIMKIADENGYVINRLCNPSAKKYMFFDYDDPIKMMLSFKEYRTGVGTFVDKKYRQKKNQKSN